MKLLVIRHGEPDYSIDSLTEKGWREAELLSHRLIKCGIDDFYCSPLGRARDTAKPTLQRLGREAEILPWLEEFRGKIQSPFTGRERMVWDLPPTIWAEEEAYYDRRRWLETELVKTGNSAEIYQETRLGIEELLGRYGVKREGMLYHCSEGSDVTVALFCHFGMGAVIVSELTGIAPFLIWHGFFMPPSSVTTLITETDRRGASHFRCVQFGDTSHLYAAGEEMSEVGLNPAFDI